MSDIGRLNRLVWEVFRVNGLLLAAGDAVVAPYRLTSARWQVLGAIVLNGAPLPVAHIARNMGLTRQSVQRLVTEMVGDGLVRLLDNPHHARAKLVRLTEAGEAAYAAANADWRPLGDALSADLDADAVAAAIAVLHHLRHGLETAAHPGDPSCCERFTP